MEPNNKIENDITEIQEEEKSSFNLSTIISVLVLNWQWFVLSLIICLGIGAIYLRYTTPVYQATAKLLIKDDDNSSGRSTANAQDALTLGLITNTNGIDNEMEILTSRQLAKATVRHLKLNVNYTMKGRVKDFTIYKDQPVTVSLDSVHLEKLNAPISMTITHSKSGYHVKGTYYVPLDDNATKGPFSIDRTITSLPATINTSAGIITFSENILHTKMSLDDDDVMYVTINPLDAMAASYAGLLRVNQTSKTTTIAQLTINDIMPQRAIDYLKQLALEYNNQANLDKNEIAIRTERFINGRLEKINNELGSTEGDLENFKKSHKMVELKMNANQAVTGSQTYEQKLIDASLQETLLNSINEYMDDPANKYQTLPSNVGLTDGSATALINKYNDIVLERNRLLRSASENSPTILPLTAALDDLTSSIKRAMRQTRRNMAIERANMARQYDRYQGQILETPGQERTLNQIGRQQEVKSGLYLMLLQKREENSISLAATADKGKLIDEPSFAGKVSPKTK